MRIFLLSVCLLASVPAHAAIAVDGSELLDQAAVDQLETWLGGGNFVLTRIYSKQPGDTAADFHAAVDNQGPTITVLEAQQDGDPYQIIGGYNPQSWDQSIAEYVYTPNPVDMTGFVFNLSTADRREQTEQSQTVNLSVYGPTWGGGHDLYVADSLNDGYANSFSYCAPGTPKGTICSYATGVANLLGKTNTVGFPAGSMIVGRLEVFRVDSMDFDINAVNVSASSACENYAPFPAPYTGAYTFGGSWVGDSTDSLETVSADTDTSPEQCQWWVAESSTQSSGQVPSSQQVQFNFSASVQTDALVAGDVYFAPFGLLDYYLLPHSIGQGKLTFTLPSATTMQFGLISFGCFVCSGVHGFEPTWRLQREGVVENLLAAHTGGIVDLTLDAGTYVFTATLNVYAISEAASSANGTASAFVGLAPLTVDIDIEPGSASNTVHPDHDGSASAVAGLNDVIAVAVLSSSTVAGDPIDFDATTIDPSTARFGSPGGAIDPASTPNLGADQDSDGLNDALLHFLTGDTGVGCADTEMTITGETTTGVAFTGTDSITADCDALCHN